MLQRCVDPGKRLMYPRFQMKINDPKFTCNSSKIRDSLDPVKECKFQCLIQDESTLLIRLKNCLHVYLSVDQRDNIVVRFRLQSSRVLVEIDAV